MRTLSRLRVSPPSLGRAFAADGAHEKNRQAWERGDREGLKFGDVWNKPDVRGALYAGQWRVCAYCSRELPALTDRGDVEHFRPKAKVTEDPAHSGYWWVAYVIENYVLSCRVCNSHRKASKFPLRPRAGRVTFDTRNRLPTEARALWYPLGDALDDWLEVDLDDPLLRIVPKAGLTPTQLRIVTTSLEFFRINLDPKLYQERRSVHDEAEAAIRNGDDFEARTLAVRFRRQSLVARDVLLRAGLALPDPVDELGVLLHELRKEIEVLELFLAKSPTDEPTTKQLDEALWCLAALLRSPPAGNRAAIEEFFDDLGPFAGLADRVNAL